MAGRLRHVGHLSRRFAGMLSRQRPSPEDVIWVESVLLEPELALWRRLPVADRRHSIIVSRRFEVNCHRVSLDPSSAQLAAALLHDIGKLESNLGVAARVIATIVGPRTRRFREYHDHERIGAELLLNAGSSDVTIGLVGGTSLDHAVRAALRDADDI